jgi:hypothetical protein
MQNQDDVNFICPSSTKAITVSVTLRCDGASWLPSVMPTNRSTAKGGPSRKRDYEEFQADINVIDLEDDDDVASQESDEQAHVPSFASIRFHPD